MLPNLGFSVMLIFIFLSATVCASVSSFFIVRQVRFFDAVCRFVNISLCLCRVNGLSMTRSRLNFLIFIAHSKHFIMILYCFV